MELTEFTDVLVCGAGPVGLLTALGLSQHGIKTILLEKKERATQEKYGRACTLYPRTIELLEPFGVVEDMLQIGVHGRSYAVYQKGQRVTRTAWQGLFPLADQSFHNYILNIRQSRSEDIFVSAYSRLNSGRGPRYGWQLENLVVEDLADGYNVTATVLDASNAPSTIRCKYLVGADGGNSTVRRLVDIDMHGNDTTFQWVRLDGKIETNMPEKKLVFAALETENHGHVLWAKLDGDAYRIGFALTPRLQKKYPAITQEQAIEEAQEALKPFSCDFKRVDWWTHYNVKQKVAEKLQSNGYILLAGDAAHTHSSAFAQGMNTGVHDASNLVWKLAGTIKGWYNTEVLESYAAERHAAASLVVSVDRKAAAAVSGSIECGNSLESIMAQNMRLTTGFGVSYTASPIVAARTTATTLVPGTRIPDASIKTLGPTSSIRLYDILNHTNNRGKWMVLAFAGYPQSNKERMVVLREALARDNFLEARKDSVAMATLIIGHVNSAWEAFDGTVPGRIYLDSDAIAHDRYCVYPENGALVVVRPDGILAHATGLDELHEVEAFFQPILV